MKRFDIIVIGASPTGLKIAAALTESGKKVALISLPGNPESAVMNELQALGLNGFLPKPLPDHAAKLELLSGMCRFESPTTLNLNDEQLEAEKFVLALGVRPNNSFLLDSLPPSAVLGKDRIPKTVSIVGAGPIGVATAFQLAQAGAQVTLVEKEDRVLPGLDSDLSVRFEKRLADSGVKLTLDTEVDSTSALKGTVVHAAGWIPNTDGFDLKKAGIFVDRQGTIVLNDEMRTSAKNIWAFGPAASGDWSPSFEIHQAELISHNVNAMFFNLKRYLSSPVAQVFPTTPPCAYLGLTETQGRREFKDVICAEHFYNEFGFVKLVGRKKEGKLLGAHAMGPGAPELMLFFQILLEAEISLYELEDARYYPFTASSSAVRDAIRTWLAKAE